MRRRPVARARHGSCMSSALAIALAGVMLAGCGPNSLLPDAGGTPTPVATSAAAAEASLTLPGHTTPVIAALRERAGAYPIIKVEVSTRIVTLAVVQDNKAITYAYTDGQISQVDSSTEYYGQASFDPDDFDLSDVDELFERAQVISGSSDHQQLQIVEYNDSQVLMTVTTRPESKTVFLRPDGSPINEIDMTSASGISEALSDALEGATQVLAVGYTASAGFWVDVVGPQADTIVRHTRPPLLPVWDATRKGTATMELFSPTEIDPARLAQLVAGAATMTGANENDPVSFTIDRRYNRSHPTIEWDVGGHTMVTDMDGLDITSQVR